MFKQGQQANVTVAFDSLEQSHIPFARVQFHVIVKDIRNSFSTYQKVDQLLIDTNRKNQCK